MWASESGIGIENVRFAIRQNGRFFVLRGESVNIAATRARSLTKTALSGVLRD
jgi:hypothetical protein